ncbi:MAG: hypothetical protein E5W94_11475 [Mesorhizobium sp.]|nr:MAG: hypothetical protein E5W94_11475 [Mesorhizobium sp.]
MTPAQKEKFFVGFFETLLLAVVVIMIVTAQMWLFTTFGPIAGTHVTVLAAALFAGFMHASTPEKDGKP